MGVSQRLYARALFEAAQDAGRLEGVRDELDDFVVSLADVPELRSLLDNPQVDPRAKVDVLQGVLGDADELVRNFLLLVAEKGRTGEIDEIAREFQALVASEADVLNVELTTAFALSDDDARDILGQIEQASGRTVEATRKVDPDLIGGIVLQAGSMRLDASVRGRLERLRHELVTRS